MTNVWRTLVWKDEVSLTIIDGTKLCQEGEKIHSLSKGSNEIFAKALLFTTFLSSCLKEERGSVSLSLRFDGNPRDITVSGNSKLYIRGAIESPNAVRPILQSLSVIREDGYSRPFVGSCAPVEGNTDKQFEEYFRLSEQLPTFIKSVVQLDEDGKILFAGMAVLQPLPFCSEETTARLQEGNDLRKAIEILLLHGGKACVQEVFGVTDPKEREAVYKCNCSKDYLLGVLASVGKEELLQIIREEGSVKIHCHYCNTDYAFTQEDVEGLFE